jgi:S-DNA-T family DNA segregation ATPase FtsK/SpoIIIE
MLTEIALGTLAAMGVSYVQDYWGIWPLKRTWDAVGLRSKFAPESKSYHVPLIVSNKATSYGRRVVVHLPSGIPMDTFLRHVPHMQEQMRSTIQVETYHSTAVLDVIRKPLPKNVPFDVDAIQKRDALLPVAIGDSGKKMVVIDLAALPHLFIAGNTGSGKSTFLHGLIVSVLYIAGAMVCVIDLKRVEYHLYNKVATIADTEKAAYRLLEWLNAELDRRLAVLKRNNLVHAKSYKGDDMPYLVLVIDELAELTDKDAQEMLNRLCRLARAAGICVVASTQRPSHTLYRNFTDTRSLFAGRVCFSVPSPEDSRMVLGDDAAFNLPRNVPGRAIFQWNGMQTTQTPFLTMDKARELVAQITPRKVDVSFEQHTKVLLP